MDGLIADERSLGVLACDGVAASAVSAPKPRPSQAGEHSLADQRIGARRLWGETARCPPHHQVFGEIAALTDYLFDEGSRNHRITSMSDSQRELFALGSLLSAPLVVTEGTIHPKKKDHLVGNVTDFVT